MPDTIVALLILVIAVLPGAIGNGVYARILGVDWRERDAATLLRILAFSVFGLALYAWTASQFGWRPPTHVLPAAYGPSADASVVGGLAPGYIGHVLASALSGGIAAMGNRLLARLARRSAHASSWDEFVTDRVGGRWIVVTLVNGEAFCGILETADASVDGSERDLLLSQPARYDATLGQYVVTEFRHLFIRATQVDSVASLRDSKLDAQLITKPGEFLFEVPNNDRSQETAERDDGEANSTDIQAAKQ